jgi:hypothetical protein
LPDFFILGEFPLPTRAIHLKPDAQASRDRSAFFGLFFRKDLKNQPIDGEVFRVPGEGPGGIRCFFHNIARPRGIREAEVGVFLREHVMNQRKSGRPAFGSVNVTLTFPAHLR